MQVICPACTRRFSVSKNRDVAICPNRDCHTPYCFRFFSDQSQAIQFHREIESWAARYLIIRKKSDEWAVAYFNERVKPLRVRSISSLVGEETLRAIQAGFSDSIGGPLTLMEVTETKAGKLSFRRIEPLEYSSKSEGALPAYMRRFTKFCQAVRTAGVGNRSGDRLCRRFDRRIALRYLKNPPYGPEWHFCWCHLVDYLVPIIIQGQIVAVLFGGQARHASQEDEAIMAKAISLAGEKIGLDTEHLLALAREGDVRIVDEPEKQKDLEVLMGVASRLRDEAQHRYSTERQVRENFFVEELSAILAEAAHSDSNGEYALWSQTDKVLARILEFLGCFQSAALFRETSLGSNRFVVVAAQGEVSREFVVDLSGVYIDDESPGRRGPILVSSQQPLLFQRFSRGLVPFRIDIAYLVRMPLRSGRHLMLFLCSPAHECRFHAQKGFCEQKSALGRRLLNNLSNSLSTEFDVLLYGQDVQNTELHNTSFLINAAHTVSLPVQSLIADASVLVDSMGQNDPNYEIAVHQLNEVLNLQLNVENLLHWRPRKVNQQSLRFESLPLFGPLREACQMFEGEARDKGCDILTSVFLDGKRYPIEPSLLGNPLAHSIALLFDPLKERFGISSDRLLRLNELSARIYLDNREFYIPPDQLIKRCFDFQFVKKANVTGNGRVKLSICGFDLELPLSDVARLHAPRMQMVRNELTLAFKNLVQNAVKYSYRSIQDGDHRFVRVECEWLPAMHRISISNYGVGILPDEIKNGLIWQDQYRGILAGDRSRPGSGLGLHHVLYVIKDMHGGKISAKSQELPTAYLTTFTVLLPFSQANRSR